MQRAIKFYEALGFKRNDSFSSADGSAVMWDQDIWLMLLTHDFYRSFLKDHQISDTQKFNSSIISFELESVEEVKQLAQRAQEAGGSFYHASSKVGEDQVYELEIKDPDGNLLSFFWMAM